MRKTICITLEEQQISDIDKQRGDIPRSRYIGSILDKHLKKTAGKPTDGAR